MISSDMTLAPKSFSSIEKKVFGTETKDLSRVPLSKEELSGQPFFSTINPKWVGTALIIASLVLFLVGYNRRYGGAYERYERLADDYYLDYLKYNADEADMNYQAILSFDNYLFFSTYNQLADSYGEMKSDALSTEQYYRNLQKELETSFWTYTVTAAVAMGFGIYFILRKSSAS